MKRLVLLATMVAGPLELSAQAPRNQYNIGAHASYLRFRSATGLANAPAAGFDATYRFGFSPLSAVSPESDFGIGLSFVASRPLSRGDQFPLVLLDFGDTTQLYAVNQRITLLHYGVQTVLGVPFGRMRVYGVAGAGAYTMQFDTRQNLAPKSYTGGMLQFGGGIGFSVSPALGFRIEARDVMFLGYDRDRLDPTVAHARDQRIRDAVNPPDVTWDKPQNLQMSVVFSYVPARAGRPEGEQ